YPTLVVRGTRVYDQWRRDDFEPLHNEEAAELIAEIKADLPKYVRLQRVQRDIPADFIDAGVWKSNLRQLARDRLAEMGETCSCIRCREVGMNEDEPENIELDVMTYQAGQGTEHFISYEDPNQNLLIGFCRLRFPHNPVRKELKNAALVRELHVYGNEVGVGNASSDAEYQHKGYGKQLIQKAEEMAMDAGYDKLSVISGIGARPYYREKLGYYQDGPYVSKQLNK
ncbi:MAG: GNAT family N-acetyltransferase, partial [Halobacteriaceae archaeon]